jgi:hypothetical protein
MIKDATLQDLHFFTEIQVGTLHRKEKFFSFLNEHHTFFGQPPSLATTLATTARMPL